LIQVHSLISQLQGRFDSSNTAPVISTLTGRFDSSNTAPVISTLSGRHETSGINDAATQLSGRHETSGINDAATQLSGRHETSGINDAATQLSGRHETSGINDAATQLSGRHETSGINTTTGVNFLNIPDSDSKGFTIQNSLLASNFAGISGQSYIYPNSNGLGLGLVDSSQGVNFIDIPNANAVGFTTFNPLLESKFVGISGQTYTYPDTQGLGFGLVDSSQGVNFIDIPNANAVGFTTFNPLFKSQFVGIAGAPGAMTYAYPDTSGQGYGSVDSSQGVNFVDIPNLDAQGFTTFFDTGTPTQFKGVTAGDYTYPDNHGLGFGLISNSLFTNTYPTPYTTPIFPDGFVQNQPIEESQFSLESFAGGGKIGLGTEGFEHATFGGVQGQVPVMGNNPTGLGQFLEGGNTSGDIGIVDAFDDTTSGAKGFTARMFDTALPKTQFNGVAGTPGALTYDYPIEVGPAGTGRLMYDMPFSDAGNPYGGLYIASLAKQIPTNPSITINKLAGTDPVQYNFYNANPDRLHFNEGNKYESSLSNFENVISINNTHPKSILADFASREHSPSPLDSIQVLIPANTGPTGADTITAKYTHVDGYPNYNTQNLSYKTAEVANQRVRFERNELVARVNRLRIRNRWYIWS
jgi:hypothetical protein